MSVQSSVDLRIAKASAGTLADINNAKLISAACESAAIGFGVVVSRGTDPETQAVLGADENGVLGISVRELGREAPSIGSVVAQYVETEAMLILQDGYIYAVCVAGCTAGDVPKFVNATGALSAGAPAAGETSLDGCEWAETVAAGGVAKLHLTNLNDLTAGS
jgi:hypothetical protein